MARGAGSDGNTVASLLALEILLYFNWWFSVLYFARTLSYSRTKVRGSSRPARRAGGAAAPLSTVPTMAQSDGPISARLLLLHLAVLAPSPPPTPPTHPSIRFIHQRPGVARPQLIELTFVYSFSLPLILGFCSSAILLPVRMGVIIHILVRCGGNDMIVSGFEGQQRRSRCSRFYGPFSHYYSNPFILLGHANLRVSIHGYSHHLSVHVDVFK